MNKILIISLISLFATFTNCSETCSKYACGTLDAGVCAKKIVKADQTDFTFQTCTDETKNFCFFTSLQTGETATCEKDTTTLPQYPGGKCDTAADCAGNISCEAKVCVGIKDGQSCTQHEQCNVGSACINKKCNPQLAVGATCADSFECKNNLACDPKTLKCVELFSLEDGASVNEVSDLTNVFASFCKSGKSVENKCRTLTLKNPTTACSEDTDCVYEYSEETAINGVFLNADYSATSKTISSLTDVCECGYNPTGAKYCKQSSGNVSDKYSSYITSLTNSLTKFECHTKERFNCRAVVADTASNVTLKTNKVHALDSHYLLGSDSCTESVVYPFVKEEPATKTCPVFSCDTIEKDKCAFATGKLSKGRKIKINKCTDKVKSICRYSPEDFIIDEDYTASCVEIGKAALSYPGETCVKKEDCLKVTTYDAEGKAVETQSCDNGVCKGANIGDQCLENESCVAGSYCNETDPVKKVCAAQLKEGTCNSSYECLNDYICYNEKCVKAFSIKIGEEIDTLDIIENACESGYSDNGKCVGMIYSKDFTPDSKGLVKCDFGSKCKYDIYEDSTTKKVTKTIDDVDCVCGYNKDGQGYCPYSYNDKSTETLRKEQLSVKLDNLDNKHHTLNRELAKTGAKQSVLCANYKVNPQYVNAVECAEEVFGLGECESQDPSSSSSSSSSKSTSSSFISICNYGVILIALLLAF